MGSIFTSISNFIGGLFGGGGNQSANALQGTYIPGSFNPNYGNPQPTSYSPGGTTYYNGYVPPGGSSTAGQYDTGNDMSGNVGLVPRYTPTPQGGGYSPSSRYMTPTPQGGGYSSNQRGGTLGTMQTPSPYRLSSSDAKTYVSGTNVGNLDVTGMTEEEARRAVDEKKAVQRGQTSALTSATYTPDQISNTSKVMKDFSLGLDTISNEAWSSTGTKQSKIENLVNVTADNIAQNFDTPEQFAQAIQSNPELQQQIDKYVKAGGTAQSILDKFQLKNAPKKNMNTADYLASVQNKQVTDQLVPENKLIQDEISRVANIPENIKNQYFGDNGYIVQRIKMDNEKVDMLRKSIEKAEATEREQLNYHIQKNNAEADIARNTIEQNKNNAKNYITGMLAKLGALNTTSAAVEGIATINQKYEQQKSELDTKLRFANQALEIESRNKINNYESKLAEKIQSIKEDLSKDTTEILKEIAKEERASKKEIFNLTLKMNDRVKKNINDYTKNATTIAETYTKNFLDLASGGMDVGKIASTLTAPLSKADQAISASIRIKDPNAINFFKSLPSEFKNQWVQYATTQPIGKYFTFEDLKQDWEGYQIEQKMPGVGVKKVTQLSDGTFRVYKPDGSSYISDTDPNTNMNQGGTRSF